MGACLALGLWLAFAAGCGGKFNKPVETTRIPTMGEYTCQHYAGFDGATSLSISGGTIYVAYADQAEIRAYHSIGTPVPGEYVKPFTGLTRPVLIGANLRSMAVVDRAAKDTVRVYGVLGGGPVLSFRDPDWAGISSLAVDDAGNIYVADSTKKFVRAYRPNGKPRFEIDLADSGFGIGHVMRPAGLAFDAKGLLIAENHPEKIQVQRVSTSEPQTGIVFTASIPFLMTFVDDEGNEMPMASPTGVAAGTDSSIFVLDQGLDMIFGFDGEGNSIAVVNSPESGGPQDLAGMASIAAYNEPRKPASIFVLDAAKGVIHRWDPK